jgi:hypothetical protein
MIRLLALSLMLATTCASAAPFLVSDTLDVRVTHCDFQFNGGERIRLPVVVSGSDTICKADLAGLAIGSHDINAMAMAISPTTGNVIGKSDPSANFTWLVPVAPSGWRIVP